MIIFPKLDEVSRNILCYVAAHGPVTMYRVARDLNLHFSHVYRKAHRLEVMDMLRRISNGRAAMYEASLWGYIYCYKFSKGGDLILAKIKNLLGLTSFEIYEVESFLKLYLAVADVDAPLSDLPTMVAYLYGKCHGDLKKCGSEALGDYWEPASRIVAYGFIQLLKKLLGDSVVVADRDFFVVVNPQRRFAIASCRLCGVDRYCFLNGCDKLRQRLEVRLGEVLKRGEVLTPWS